MWVGDSMKSSGVSNPPALMRLGPWIEPMLAEQAKAAASAAVEEQRKKALPVPTVESVLARLRNGERIDTGVARYCQTYFLEGATLRCETVDEAHAGVEDATVEALAKAIESRPDDFRTR